MLFQLDELSLMRLTEETLSSSTVLFAGAGQTGTTLTTSTPLRTSNQWGELRVTFDSTAAMANAETGRPGNRGVQLRITAENVS